MISRSRSASNMAASSIEPTTSAKRTVTCLRSPTARLGLTADPQASQKRADARRPFPQTPQHRSDPPSTGSTPTPYPTDDQLEHPTVALPPGGTFGTGATWRFLGFQ